MRAALLIIKTNPTRSTLVDKADMVPPGRLCVDKLSRGSFETNFEFSSPAMQ